MLRYPASPNPERPPYPRQAPALPRSAILLPRLLPCVRIQRLTRIITHCLDNPKPFRASFTEQDSIARRQIFRPLYEPESDNRAVAGADVCSVDVDDGAGL